MQVDVYIDQNMEQIHIYIDWKYGVLADDALCDSPPHCGYLYPNENQILCVTYDPATNYNACPKSLSVFA